MVPTTSPKPSLVNDFSPSFTADLEYASTPSYSSSLHTKSPGSEKSVAQLASPSQENAHSESELSNRLDDFDIAPLTPSAHAYTIPDDLFTHQSHDFQLFPIQPFELPPSLPVPTLWSPILPSLPPSLRAILSHYEYTTALTLHPSDPAKAAWLTHLPSLSASHAYLLNCVLSVSSLHLGRLGASSRLEMNALAASRMNKALTTYRTELANVTRDNAAALFASATLTSVYLFATTHLDMEDLRSSIASSNTTDPPAELVSKMLACALRPIWGLRGPLTVLMSGWSWVVSGQMQSVAARKWWPSELVPATPQAFEEDERLAHLQDLWTECRAETQEALEYLRDAYKLVSQLTLKDVYPPMTAIPYAADGQTVGTLTDRGAIFVWATQISRDFMQRIEMRDRDALVVLAHYAILPGRVRNVWWLEGLGADLVMAVAMVLSRENWALIEWPASVVGVDLENLFGPRDDRLEGRPEEMGMEVI